MNVDNVADPSEASLPDSPDLYLNDDNETLLWLSKTGEEGEAGGGNIGSLQLDPSSNDLRNVIRLGNEKWGERFSLLPFCSRSTAIKTALFVLNLGVFGTTTFFIVYQSLGSRNVIVLSVCALINGATVSNIFHMILGSRTRKKINALVSAWAYETILAFSQVYLNVVPPDLTKLAATPFIWSLGVFEAKDVLTLWSMKKTDLSLSTVAPTNPDELISTLAFKTRDHSKKAKFWLGGLVVASIALTVFNFVCKDRWLTSGDFGQIGLYQDLISMFVGSVAGELAARGCDDYKERSERRYSQQLLGREMPKILKIIRVSKNGFVLFSPLTIGLLLGLPAPPNSIGDFFSKFTVGAVYGAKQLIDRREFENPLSPCHAIGQHPNRIQGETTIQKVQAVAKKYLPSAAFFSALVGYMSWAAATNIPLVDYAIVVLVITTLFFFFLTDLISMRGQFNRNNRLGNELVYRLSYSAMSSSIFFQYLTTKVDIGDQQLSGDSWYLYGLSLLAWFFWGLVVGNNRAVNIQPRVYSALPITPPIAKQELSKRFIENL